MGWTQTWSAAIEAYASTTSLCCVLMNSTFICFHLWSKSHSYLYKERKGIHSSEAEYSFWLIWFEVVNTNKGTCGLITGPMSYKSIQKYILKLFLFFVQPLPQTSFYILGIVCYTPTQNNLYNWKVEYKLCLFFKIKMCEVWVLFQPLIWHPKWTPLQTTKVNFWKSPNF